MSPPSLRSSMPRKWPLPAIRHRARLPRAHALRRPHRAADRNENEQAQELAGCHRWGSPKARRSYDPDRHAALTLGELEAWFAQQVVGRYHQDPHRGLKGGTPAGAWALHPAPALPPAPLKRFPITFLPAISRTLRRDGIVFEHLRHWHPIFSQWLARRERLTLHFDPPQPVQAVCAPLSNAVKMKRP